MKLPIFITTKFYYFTQFYRMVLLFCCTYTLFFGVLPNRCSLFSSEHMVGASLLQPASLFLYIVHFELNSRRKMFKERAPWGFGKDLLELVAKNLAWKW